MWLEGAFQIADFPPEAFQTARRRFSLRRSDRYTTMILSTVAGLTETYGPLPEDTGLIIASSYGPHRTSHAFLDDLLDYREEDVMPTTFSHSVYNAAASYAAFAFGLAGPEFSLTGFENLFGEAFSAARLCAAMTSRMLLVCVEESALLTQNVSRHVCEVAPEGASAFLVAFEKTERAICELTFTCDLRNNPCRTPVELMDALAVHQHKIEIWKGDCA